MIEIKVPATSANIGPGFDCLGLALNMYNSFWVEETGEKLEISGCEKEFQNEDNLFYYAMKKCFERIGYKQKGIKIIMKSDVPVSRGLGSSATCIIGGILAANEIAGNVLNTNEILEIATKIEGHPDNLTPALVGGMTASICENDRVYYQKINIAKGLKFCALIPNTRLSTNVSRDVLPEQIPFKKGVFNIGRTALMVSSFINGDFDLLSVACKDKLHQDYRGKMIDNYFEVVKKCEEEKCKGVFLSGAGPTIMVMIDECNYDFIKKIETFLNGLNTKWTIKELNIDFEGAKVIKNS